MDDREFGLDHARLVERLRTFGVVPVVQLPDPGLAVPLAETLMAAGIANIEITFRAARAPEAIAAVRDKVPEMLVGAGTVLTPEDAELAIAAGAGFIVAPGTNPSVVEAVTAAGVMMLPGVATPSEIEAVVERGLSVMKFFPASVSGGIEWLRAVQGPYRQARFVPTGGVTLANLRDYLERPNVVACGGTWLAPAADLECEAWPEIGRRAREAAALVRSSRAGEADSTDGGGS